ncbi:MAG: hypothetical protein K8R55_03665 [Desulfuromonadaceae bacterium]|nr:hypothetical protein [Desulfuromonadaceae bacterium]
MKDKRTWYTSFIKEASKLGAVDQTILQRKRGVVERLRSEVDSDPEGAAYAYMQVQKDDQDKGENIDNELERPSMLSGVAKEELLNSWLDTFCAPLGAGAFKELREISDASMHAVYGDDSSDTAMAVLSSGCDRVIEIAEQALIERREDISNACKEVCCFLEDLGLVYAQKVANSLPPT